MGSPELPGQAPRRHWGAGVCVCVYLQICSDPPETMPFSLLRKKFVIVLPDPAAVAAPIRLKLSHRSRNGGTVSTKRTNVTRNKNVGLFIV